MKNVLNIEYVTKVGRASAARDVMNAQLFRHPPAARAPPRSTLAPPSTARTARPGAARPQMSVGLC